MQRKWLIMGTVSLAFFFVTATTFTSLGVVLYTMVAELHWSQSAAGFSFSLLGLACGLTSPLPAIVMKGIGTRCTMLAGALILALGFLLASASHGLPAFFAATCLMGAGFTLLAPVPAIYLLATWFPQASSRMIGIYFMAGAFGGVIGPPVVEAIVDWSASWRLHWLLMAASAVVLGLLCLLVVKDAVSITDASEVEKRSHYGATPAPGTGAEAWTARQAIMTRQFLLVALAMLVVQTGVTTVHGMLVMHVAHLGASRAYGALAMSLVALSGTLAKGVAGALSERLHPRWLLLAGLVLQGLAFLLLGLSHTPALALAFAVVFGTGWGTSWLCAHVLLLRYFGPNAAPGVVAAATTMTTAAVVGPTAAGLIADSTGSFAPIFLVFAGLYVLVMISTALMRAPTARGDGTRRPLGQDQSYAGADEQRRLAAEAVPATE